MPAARVTLLVLASLGGIAVSACGSDGGSSAEPIPTTRAAPATAGATDTSSRSDAPDAAGAPGEALPDREPDVVGVVAMDGAFGPGAHLASGSASDSYYEGMALLGGDPVILDADSGSSLTAIDLVDGAQVEVWVSGGCAESYPVQCTIGALRVAVPPS